MLSPLARKQLFSANKLGKDIPVCRNNYFLVFVLCPFFFKIHLSLLDNLVNIWYDSGMLAWFARLRKARR